MQNKFAVFEGPSSHDQVFVDVYMHMSTSLHRDYK